LRIANALTGFRRIRLAALALGPVRVLPPKEVARFRA
jgi:hypothetical protein